MSFDELMRDLEPGASAQAAGIRRGYGGPAARTVSAVSGLTRLRCASLLKPLYAWVAAAHMPDAERWAAHAQPAVVISSNSDTLNLWLGVGPAVLLADLARRTGVSWEVPNGDLSRFGSVEVAATEVATAYAALAQAALAGDPVADSIMSWMREVTGPQTYGAREAIGSPGAGIKCGWYGGADETCLRTHAVAILPRRGTRTTVAVAMTAQPYTDAREREVYHARIAEGLPVEQEHEKAGGPLLRALLSTTVAELGHRHSG
ncbi:MAG: hypothetical protein HOY71_54785 [Nonomuraea sp.]|nr:hypothetical protein [Nonomuraea sp.]